MYRIGSLLFIIMQAVLIASYGWTALLWFPLGFFAGLFPASNMLLLVLLGAPLATSLVLSKRMRPTVFLWILSTPVIWLIMLFVLGLILGSLWPSALDWILANTVLQYGVLFAVVFIVLSPLSKKCRDDFNTDFYKAYARHYYIDPKDLQLNAAITVITNLYLHTTSASKDTLRFQLQDSKYRYLVLCMSGMVKACEDVLDNPDSLITNCIHELAIFTTSQDPQEFFGASIGVQDAETKARDYFDEFTRHWVTCFDAVQSGKEVDAITTLTSMIHFAESNEPADETDLQRLEELSLRLECFMPELRGAFIDLKRFPLASDEERFSRYADEMRRINDSQTTKDKLKETETEKLSLLKNELGTPP
jgi:hypothetical protein